tara:strand:- start:1608 stop:1988 length:381 start_codon:yes stop_codon:yes gene_type:complete
LVEFDGGDSFIMAVKLAVLKSGEDVVADIKELVDDDGNTVSLVFQNPVVVKLVSPQTLLEGENENEYRVAFIPWIPLSAEDTVAVQRDWVVTIVEPVELVKSSYEERMNGRQGDNVSAADQQLISG